MRNWALRTEDYNIMQNNAFTNQDWQWNLPKSDGKDLKECSLLAKLANNKEAPSLHTYLTAVFFETDAMPTPTNCGWGDSFQSYLTHF